MGRDFWLDTIAATRSDDGALTRAQNAEVEQNLSISLWLRFELACIHTRYGYIVL